MKVIFLDFDGVLNHRGYLLSLRDRDRVGGDDDINPDAVAKLNRLIQFTGAQVVVSSSWRHGRDIESLQELLESRGFAGKVISKTPMWLEPEEIDQIDKGYRAKFGDSGERGHEIRAWLANNSGVESFIVFDDNGDMATVHDRFIQTDFDSGLQDHHVDKAIKMLNGDK